MNTELKRKRARQAHRYRPFTRGLDYCVICDVDNTLAHTGYRDYYDMRGASKDPVIVPVRNILNKLHEDYRVIIITSRDERYREMTTKWLEDNNVEFDEIYIRKTGDRRPDIVFKKEIYDKYIKNKFNVFAVIEDRKGVCKMFREDCGLFVLQVAEGNY